jgi:hydroxymethylglutaryl-CoA reductase
MTPTTQNLDPKNAKFYNLTLEERLQRLAEQSGLTAEELAALAGSPGLTPEQANNMVENVVGTYALPLGIAQNFVVNGRLVLVPMVVVAFGATVPNRHGFAMAVHHVIRRSLGEV